MGSEVSGARKRWWRAATSKPVVSSALSYYSGLFSYVGWLLYKDDKAWMFRGINVLYAPKLNRASATCGTHEEEWDRKDESYHNDCNG